MIVAIVFHGLQEPHLVFGRTGEDNLCTELNA